jgi:predicted RNA binding protein YcfA (HicA-like mRNA interferase family)
MRHRDDPGRRATVPVHPGKDIPPGILRAILKGAKLEVDEIRNLL